MEIKFYKAICNKCSYVFTVPVLGDMSYGEFIAKGDKGNIFGYLNAFDNEEAWKYIEYFFTKLCNQNNKSSDCRDGIEQFYYIIGKCLDKIEGQELSIVGFPKCPNCRIPCGNFNDNDNNFIEKKDIPRASFEEFLSLNDFQRKKHIYILWNELYIKLHSQ
jgi:hypothetical protein